MNDHQQQPGTPKRSYPQVYEKLVPFALGVLGLAIIILVLITMGVAMGLWTRPI